MSDKPHSRWTTKRMFFSVAGFVTSTALLVAGNISCDCWVMALAIVIAGHHAEDLVKAWKGT